MGPRPAPRPASQAGVVLSQVMPWSSRGTVYGRTSVRAPSFNRGRQFVGGRSASRPSAPGSGREHPCVSGRSVERLVRAGAQWPRAGQAGGGLCTERAAGPCAWPRTTTSAHGAVSPAARSAAAQPQSAYSGARRPAWPAARPSLKPSAAPRATVANTGSWPAPAAPSASRSTRGATPTATTSCRTSPEPLPLPFPLTARATTGHPARRGR